MKWSDWDTRNWDSGFRGFLTFQFVVLALTLGGLGLVWLVTEWVLG